MEKHVIHRIFTWLAALAFLMAIWGLFIVVTTGQWAENHEERCSDECISCEWTTDLPPSSKKYLPRNFFEARGLEVDANFVIIHHVQVAFFVLNVVVALLTQFLYLGDMNTFYYLTLIFWSLAGGFLNGFTAAFAKERSDFFRDRAISEERAVENVEQELILQFTFIRTRLHILMEKQGLAISVNETLEEQRTIVALDNIQRKLHRELETVTGHLTNMKSMHGVCFGDFETNTGCVTRKYFACIAGMASVSSAMCFSLLLLMSYMKFTTRPPQSDSREDIFAEIRPELRNESYLRSSFAIPDQ